MTTLLTDAPTPEGWKARLIPRPPSGPGVIVYSIELNQFRFWKKLLSSFNKILFSTGLFVENSSKINPLEKRSLSSPFSGTPPPLAGSLDCVDPMAEKEETVLAEESPLPGPSGRPGEGPSEDSETGQGSGGEAPES